MEEFVMTVLDEITLMISTGFTGLPLIVGTHLVTLRLLVMKEIGDIEYDRPVEYYTKMSYHNLWEIDVRPVVAKYVMEHLPSTWFVNVYTLNLKPN
jgi:hypothetical protein